MKFTYLMLAAAANSTPNGKANVLGAGVREVNPVDFPVSIPLAIVGRVEGAPEDAGEHRLLVTIDGPDKKRNVLVDDGAVRLGAPEADANRGYAALNFQIAMVLGFERAGERVIRATYGKKQLHGHSWLTRPRKAELSQPAARSF